MDLLELRQLKEITTAAESDIQVELRQDIDGLYQDVKKIMKFMDELECNYKGMLQEYGRQLGICFKHALQLQAILQNSPLVSVLPMFFIKNILKLNLLLRSFHSCCAGQSAV